MSNILKTFALFITILGLAACGAPTKAPETQKANTVSATTPTPTVAATPAPKTVVDAPSTQLSDGVYKDTISGKTATLTIRGGQPVAYNWGSYNGKSLSLDGDTIKVDAATLTIKSVTSNKIAGRWVLRGKGTNVSFVK